MGDLFLYVADGCLKDWNNSGEAKRYNTKMRHFVGVRGGCESAPRYFEAGMRRL